MNRSERGFSLVELLVAVGILVTCAACLMPLLVLSAASGRASRCATLATVLAGEKLEQLRACSWTLLAASPESALFSDTPGYVDYLDGNGAWLGSGISPPEGSVFVRRWSIEPLPDDPGHAVVLQVVVMRIGAPDISELSFGRLAEKVRFVTVRTRRTT